MKQTQSPPVPVERHFLLGHLPKVMHDILSYFSEVQQKYGEYVQLKAPVKAGEMVVIFDPDGVRHVLQINHRNYTKGDMLKIIKPLVGDGLVTSSGDFWRKQRRLIQPMFYREQVGQMMTVIAEVVEELMAEWEVKYPDGSLVNITNEMDHLALRVVARALFKTDMESAIPVIDQHLPGILNRFMNRFRNPVLYASWFPTPANRREKNSIDAILKVVQEIIREKRAGTIPGQGDVLDLLLAVEDADTGEKMSDKQIQDELVTMLLAGHETTAHAMSYAIFSLTDNPQVATRLRESLQEATGKGPAAVGPKGLRDIAYLQQVVKETLRLYPPAFTVQRQALEEDNINGYTIPKGMNVFLPIFHVHRLEKYWASPLEFKPERFAPENIKDLPKFAYFPFSGGPHLCIGEQFAQAEMSILLARLYSKFEFRNEDNYKLEVIPAMSLQPKEDIQLRLYRRKLEA